MSWVTIIWSMVASTCLTLGVLHLLVWCRNRTAWANLLFASTAIATAGVAACEFWMMRAGTTVEFGTAVRWLHVPAWLMIVSLVGFVRLYLGAGRRWLAWAVCGVRTLSFILNFVFSPNLNYREITSLRQVRFLGESISIGEGVPNPWMLVGQTSLLLLIVFAVDATITAWRRGNRRPALLLGGPLVFFTLMGAGQVVLVFWDVIQMPITASLVFMCIVAAMGYDLSHDVLRAAELSAELRESEERMTLAAEAAGFGVWVWNIETKRVWGSDRWLRLFGFAPDAAVNLDTVVQRIHPDDREAVEREVRKALADQTDYAGEYRVVLPDSTERWIAARGRIRLDKQGKPARMMGAAIDITRRKQSELEIVQQRSELAHLSRVTTLSELSGSLAHELNQPLAIILTNAQAAQRLLAQQPPDLAEARDILADIVSEDQRAGDVIRRLRALLKPGQVQLLPLSVTDVIEDVLRIARSDLIRRGITVHAALAGTVPSVVGDRIQLQQVLLNLILNAGEAMAANPPSGRHLTIETAHRDGAVRISVSDIGCGLPPNAERIFEPFYTTRRDGLGLGLSICRSIATAHKGRLWAESNVPAAATTGCGATFHLELPAAEEGTP